MNALAYSSAYLAGLRRGYRLAGRSFPRRLFGVLLITAILWGSGFAFAWASADLFSRLTTGEAVSIVILNKWQSWFRVFPR